MVQQNKIDMIMKQEHALKIICPKCGAKRNRACFGSRGQLRISCHKERHQNTFKKIVYNIIIDNKQNHDKFGK